MTTAVLDKSLLRQSITAILPFVDPLSSHYALGNVLTIIDDQFVRLVATDGRALCTITMPARTNGKGELLLDKKELSAFRTGKKHDPNCLLKFADKSWEIDNGATPIRGVATEGRFPRWDVVVPTQTPEATITGKRSEISDLYPAPPPGQLVSVLTDTSVRSNLPETETGVYAATIAKGIKSTGNSQVYLARDYVHQILACWKPNEPITLELHGPDSAAVFKSDSKRLAQITCVVMPLHMGKK